MLCYTLMLFNFHCPNKVYGKQSQSNQYEIHQGDKCLGSWLGLCKDISSPKGTGQTRNTTVPRGKALWHKKKTKKNKPASIIPAGEKNVPEESVLTFRVSAVHISLGV